MKKIHFYQDRRGKEPVREFIEELAKQATTNKHSRVRFDKIHDYLRTLTLYGTRVGMPVVRHIEGDIWELRPTSDRIFFFCHVGDTFVLLHHFQKKTQKTPPREREQAMRNYKDFLERS